MKKKITAILTTIAIVIGLVPAAVFAETAAALPYTDDFSSYEVTETALKASASEDVTLAGDWKIKSTTSHMSGYDNDATYEIVNLNTDTDTTHGNVVRIESRAEWDKYNMMPEIYNSSFKADADNAYIYEFDFMRKDGQAGGGIRFNVNGNNYYELYFRRDSGKAILNKISNGVRTQLNADIHTVFYSGEVWGTGNGLIGSEWYRVKLYSCDGVIMWDVYRNGDSNNKNDDGSFKYGRAWQHGSYFDSECIKSNEMLFGFFAGGQGGQYAYFDNVKVDKSEKDDGTFEGFSEQSKTPFQQYQSVMFAGAWYTKINAGGTVAIEDLNDGAHNKALKIESRAAYDSYTVFPTLFNTAWYKTASCESEYKFDIKRAGSGTGGGIRFNYSTAGSGNKETYYELFFKRTDGNGLGWQLAKCVDGTYTTVDSSSVTLTQVGESSTQSLTSNKWFTVKVNYYNGQITWRVTDENGDVWQTGSWTDSEPIADANTSAGLFAAGQYNEYTYFDNVSATAVNRDRTDYSEYEDGFVFETFEDVDLVSGAKAGTSLSEDWLAVGGGYDGNATYSVIEDPTGRAGRILQIETRYAHNEGIAVTVQNETANFNQDDKYTYRFNYYQANDQGGGGIRFNISGKYFYELFFAGSNYNGGSKGTTLYKMVNGTYSQISANIVTTKNGDTVSNNRLSQKTWYTVTVTVEKGVIDWQVHTLDGTLVQTGSANDRGSTFTHISYDGYKMAVFGMGQGGNYVYFDNIFVSAEKTSTKLADMDLERDNETYKTENADGTYTFTDKFGGYDSKNAATKEQNAVYANKFDTTVADNGEFSWVLSKKISDSGANGAYINPLTKKLNTAVTYPEGYAPWGSSKSSHNPLSVVNMAFDNAELNELKAFEIKGLYLTSCRFGVRFAVSEDENSYFEIGCGEWWDASEDSANHNNGTVTGYPRRAPYIVKCIDGVRTIVAYKHETDDKFGNDQSERTFGAEIDGNSIKVTVKTSVGTYEETITDTDGILAAAKYPVAVWAGNNAYFDDVSVTASLTDKELTVSGGTAKINVTPSVVKRGLNSATVVTAFFDSNGNPTGTPDSRTTSGGEYSVTVPANTAETRLMIFDGAVSDSPVKVVSTAYETKTPSADKIVVAAIGDSNTGTWLGGVAYHTWPSRLGVLLGEDYEVHNFGKPSYRLMNGFNVSYTTCEEYEESLKIDADICLIMLGTNDYGWSEDKDATDKQFYADYVSLINSYRTAYGNDTRFILAVPPIRGSAEQPDTKVETYIRPLVKKIAEDEGLEYVDMAAYMQDYDLLYDGLHFKPEGYYRFADCFHEAIMKKVNVKIDGDKAVVNSALSFTGDIPAASYKYGDLEYCLYAENETLTPSVDYEIPIADLSANNSDEIKVMLWLDELTSYTNAFGFALKPVTVDGNTVTVRGKTDAGKEASVVVYDGSGNVVYANSSKSDDGYYSFTVTLPSGNYTCNGNEFTVE